MTLLENLALVVALLAAPCVAISVRLLRLDSFALIPRLCLWAAAFLCLLWLRAASTLGLG